MTKFIERRKAGKGFAYYSEGTLISDKNVILRINSLAIPPAWRDVEIAMSEKAKILATGRDDNGRRQAIYNPSFRAKQDKKKFNRILDFATRLPKLRQQIEKDLAKRALGKEKVVAAAVKLIDEAYFRVGNRQYAQNGHYGITTLRSKHVDVTSYSVTFDFVGKSGKQQHKTISDRRMSHIIRQLDETPGQELFRYQTDDGFQTISSVDVNAYVKQYMGDEFSAKDFRTWGGTLGAVDALAAVEHSNTLKQREKAIREAVKKVARRLGNTPAVAKASYIDPVIFDRYLSGHDFAKVRQTIVNMRPKKYVSTEEQTALQILQQK